MVFESFNQVIEQAKHSEEIHVAVAAAHDKEVLLAIKMAMEHQLIVPHLVGRKKEIIKLSDAIGFPLNNIEIEDVDTEDGCAYKAAQLADEGTCQLIMKGMVNSAPFLKGVLNKQLHLKTGNILSHISAFEIPNRSQLIFVTDGGLNIAPNVMQRLAIIRNAVEFLVNLGIQLPKVALLAANERLSEKMPVTVECKEIMSEIDKSDFKNQLIIEGPLPLDLAISKSSLNKKGLKSKVDGEANLLVVPNIESGNILGKALTYFAQGTMAGVVLGAKVPLILNSRSDPVEAKVASIALAVLSLSK